MQARKHQNGVTLLGVLIILALIGFFVLVGLKLFPVYMEIYKVKAGLASLVEEPGIEKKSKRQIYKLFLRRMDVEDVDRFNSKTVKEYLKITINKNKVTINSDYEIRAPLFQNLFIVADFKHEVTN